MDAQLIHLQEMVKMLDVISNEIHSPVAYRAVNQFTELLGLVEEVILTESLNQEEAISELESFLR